MPEDDGLIAKMKPADLMPHISPETQARIDAQKVQMEKAREKQAKPKKADADAAVPIEEPVSQVEVAAETQ